MIRLSEDGKSLIEIHSYEELYERCGFRESLDLKQHKLKQILGPYGFKEKAPCGLSSCRTLHNKGYLVAVEGGLETNIGHKCGSNIFGVEWGHQKKISQGLRNQARYRENLESLRHRLPDIVRVVDSLLSGATGAKQLLERLNYWLNKGFDTPTLNGLKQRATKGNSSVMRAIRISERDVGIEELQRNSNATDDEATSFNTPTYKEEILFVIRGLKIVSNVNKFKRLVNSTFGDKLLFFTQVNIDTLSPNELKNMNNWGSKLEKSIEELRTLRNECALFLNQANIEQITQCKHLIQKAA